MPSRVITDGTTLGAARPIPTQLDIGRITHPLFNRLWSRASASWLATPQSLLAYDPHINKFATTNGNPTVAWHPILGPCIDLDGTGDYIQFSHHIQSYIPGYTIALLIEFDTVGVYVATCNAGANSGNTMVHTTSNFRLNNDGVATSSFGVASVTGVPVFLAVSAGLGVGNVLMRRLDTGVVTTATGAWSHATTATTGSTFGSASTGGSAQNGRIAGGYTGTLYLTMEELIQWSLDPWGLWREDEERPAYKAAAGGATTTALDTDAVAVGTAASASLVSVNVSSTAAATGTLNAAATITADLSSIGASTAILEGAEVSGAAATDLSAAGAAVGTLEAALRASSDLTSTGAAVATLVGAAIDNSAPTDLSVAGAATGTLAAALLSDSNLTSTGAAVGTLEGVAVDNAVTADLSAAGAAAGALASATLTVAAMTAAGEAVATLSTTEQAQNPYLTWGAHALQRRRVLDDEDEEILALVAAMAPRLFKRGHHRDITYH